MGFRLKFCFLFVISHPRPRFSFCILFDWSPLYLKGINHGASHFVTFSWALCCWTYLVSSCEWNYRHCLSPQIRNSQRFRGCICHRFHLVREEGRISWGLSSLQGLRLVFMTFPPALVLHFSRSIWRWRPMQLPKHKFLTCDKKGKGKGRLWILQHWCLEAYCTLTQMSSFIHLQRRCTCQAAWETSASEGRNYTWNLASNP